MNTKRERPWLWWSGVVIAAGMAACSATGGEAEPGGAAGAGEQASQTGAAGEGSSEAPLEQAGSGGAPASSGSAGQGGVGGDTVEAGGSSGSGAAPAVGGSSSSNAGGTGSSPPPEPRWHCVTAYERATCTCSLATTNIVPPVESGCPSDVPWACCYTSTTFNTNDACSCWTEARLQQIGQTCEQLLQLVESAGATRVDSCSND